MSQITAFVKLEVLKYPVKLDFIVCSDDRDEGLLSLDTLKELSIVSKDFPLSTDRGMRETKINRVKKREREDLEKESVERLK